MQLALLKIEFFHLLGQPQVVDDEVNVAAEVTIGWQDAGGDETLGRVGQVIAVHREYIIGLSVKGEVVACVYLLVERQKHQRGAAFVEGDADVAAHVQHHEVDERHLRGGMHVGIAGLDVSFEHVVDEIVVEVMTVGEFFKAFDKIFGL